MLQTASQGNKAVGRILGHLMATGMIDGNDSWITRWWQLKYLLFSPLFGEDSHFD